MLVRHKTPPAYRAIRWTGRNLRELQDLTFPSSPVWGPGINNPGLPTGQGLIQVPMGHWVLRVTDVPEFMVLSAETFEQIFTEIVEEPENSRRLH